jgi:hypothetical protein
VRKPFVVLEREKKTVDCKLYYLEGDTDRDMHDGACCCGIPSTMPHRAVGASLYELDVAGLQALYAFVRGEDDDSFGDWCNAAESQATYYGRSEKAAIAEALYQTRKGGWLVVNYPERFPEILSLVGLLRGVVDENDGYLSPDVCECNDTHEQNQTVCRVCYARLVCTILWQQLPEQARAVAQAINGVERGRELNAGPVPEDPPAPLPYAYMVALTTHQMLYQDVIVESERPLTEEECEKEALEHSTDNWEPGPIDKNPDVGEVQTLRSLAKEGQNDSEDGARKEDEEGERL